LTREFLEALICSVESTTLQIAARTARKFIFFWYVFALIYIVFVKPYCREENKESCGTIFYSGVGFELKGKYKSQISNGYLPSKDEKCKLFYSMLTTAAVRTCLYSYGCVQRWC